MTSLSTLAHAVGLYDAAPVLTPQGHLVHPIIDVSTVEDCAISAGGLEIPPGFLAPPHWHPETDVVVIVFDCGEEGVITFCGDQLQVPVYQQALQVLPIRRGRPHNVLNLSLTTPIRAAEFRANKHLFADNVVRADLQPQATPIARKVLDDVHGADRVDYFLEHEATPRTRASWGLPPLE